jgi:hypothetical protein
LNLFNSGEIQVLVATCIAEEGLDIAEVDLIISYDMVASPIRMIQRNGRTGRKRDGKVVILITEGKEEEKLCQSMDRMDVMQNSIEIQKLVSQLHFLTKSTNQIITEEMGEQCVMVERNLGPQPSSTTSSTSSSSLTSSSRNRISDLFCDLTVPTQQPPAGRDRISNTTPPSLLSSSEPIEVVDLAKKSDKEDLFAWPPFHVVAAAAAASHQPTITSLFAKANSRPSLAQVKRSEPREAKVVEIPPEAMIDLSESPVIKRSALSEQQVSKDCSVCGLKFTVPNGSLDLSSSLCPVCVEMMCIPVSQDDPVSPSAPPPLPPQSPPPLWGNKSFHSTPSAPPPLAAAAVVPTSPAAVTFQISPATSDPGKGCPTPSPFPSASGPSGLSRLLYHTLENVLSSRLNLEQELSSADNDKIQLINSHLDVSCLLQQPSNSSQHYPPFPFLKSNSTPHDSIPSPSWISPPPSLQPAAEVNQEAKKEGGMKRGLDKSRYQTEISSFPQLASQDSGESLNLLRVPSALTFLHRSSSNSRSLLATQSSSLLSTATTTTD